MNKAIKLMEDNSRIITDLQLYGRLGVSSKYFMYKMRLHPKFPLIEELFCRNKQSVSTIVTDKLIKIAEDDGKENVRALDLLGRIADKQMRRVFIPQVKNDEEDQEQEVKKDPKELVDNIKRMIKENGFH